MPRLFERFHRVENARGRTHEGSGIGLALVQELVKLHGGSITAESVVGTGTSFSVTLPLGSAHLPTDQIGEGRSLASTGTGAMPYVEEALRWLPDDLRGERDDRSELPTHHEPLPTPYRQPDRASGDDRPRVLVADDNADMREYVARLLAEHYRIQAVPDGEAALAAARERTPDLILTDVMMPRLDGFGLLRELRADPRTRNVPVLMLSARAGEESRVEGMEAGADDYLIKPFGARELLARVGAHLQMARMRREASEALRQSHARFEALFDAAPLGVYLVDADLRIRAVNPKARPVFGGIDGLLGSDFVEVIHVLWPKENADEIVGRFRQTLETGEPYFAPEHIEERLDLKAVEYYEWQLHRLTLPDGRYGVVCYFSDISRHVLTRQALAEADRLKDEFLATLAHELRNPLAPIRNGLKIMKLAGGNPVAVEKSRMMMERQVGQMTHLIDDLMDLSRIRGGKIVLQKVRLKVSDVVQDAVDTSRPLIEERGHELVVDVPPEPLYVDADRTRLAQVFGNLLNNAAKYTETGGRIRVAVERQGGDVVVAVEDNGVGIPAHMLTRVFDMFAQVDHSLEKSQGGLGIGLNIVKRLTEMHDGSIVAESGGHGTGSRFVVRLPVALAVTTDGPDDHNEVPQAKPARRRILVVDDNRDGATSLAEMLGIMGNDTQTAFDGLEAVAVAEAFRPDVILMDIGMPKLNGCESCRRIREQTWGRGIVIVAQTGWGQEDDKRKSQEAGFDFHMVKPVDPAALEKILATCRAGTG